MTALKIIEPEIIDEPEMVDEPTSPLAQLERAHIMLAEASTLDDVKLIRDQAEALAAYSKAAKLGLTMQNECAELKLRAERKAGEMLRAMPKHGGGRPSENRLHDVTSSLADVGVTKIQSHRWQQVAAVPVRPARLRALLPCVLSVPELDGPVLLVILGSPWTCSPCVAGLGHALRPLGRL